MSEDWAEQNWDAIVRLPLIESPMRQCMVRGCHRERRAKGLCLAHYKQARTEFDLAWAEEQKAKARAKAKEKAESDQTTPSDLRPKKPWSEPNPYRRPKRSEKFTSVHWSPEALTAAIDGIRSHYDPDNPAWDAPDLGTAGTVPSAEDTP